jgi:small subunit ribosomal protein S11
MFASLRATSSRVRLDCTLPARHVIRQYTGDATQTAQHTLTVTSTRNNLLMTYADQRGPLFPTITAGTDKTFKKAGRASFEAAHQATLKMMKRITDRYQETGGVKTQITIALKGYNGQGGEAFQQALAGPDGADVRKMVARVEDRTGVKIGGTRSRKPRRL